MPPEPTAALEARFQQLAATLTPEDWDKLVRRAGERILRGLVAAELIGEADPAGLTQGLEVIGNELVAFANVALTMLAERQLQQEGPA